MMLVFYTNIKGYRQIFMKQRLLTEPDRHGSFLVSLAKSADYHADIIV